MILSRDEVLLHLINNGVLTEEHRYNFHKGTAFLKLTDNDVVKYILYHTSFLPDAAPKSQIIHAIVHNLTSLMLCEQCNKKPVKFVSFNQGYKTFCSSRCAQVNPKVRAKRDQTCITKYGSTNVCDNEVINKKRESTCMLRYGSKTPFESTKIQKKVRNTVNNRYGVNSTALVPEIRNRQQNTRNKRYGVKFPFQSTGIQKKVNKTHNILYKGRYSKGLISSDSLNKLNNKDWLYDEHIIQQKSLSLIASELQISDVTVGTYLHKYGYDTQYYFNSIGENQIATFVQKLLINTDIQLNVRNVITPYELDIYIPSHRLAIEYCGLYWHSDKFKTISYHKNKLNLCNKHNIRLLTIFEDEWQDNNSIIEAKIKSILNMDNRSVVYARHTNVIPITHQEKQSFLNEYHIQGAGPSSIAVGLMCNNTIVAVMTFKRRRDTVFELTRYATSHRVVGGFSKLLAHFKKHHDWTEIISFADLRWSDGNLYKQTGWVLDKILSPDYYWCKNGKRFHKFNFRHKQLAKKLENYDQLLSEHHNCKAHGYNKLYDCGLIRFIMYNNENKFI